MGNVLPRLPNLRLQWLAHAGGCARERGRLLQPEAEAAPRRGRWAVSKETNMKHPMQPFVKTDQGTVRFKRNAIVRYLLDHGGIDLNQIAEESFSQNDLEQFAQLIGYSLCGYHELSYVSDKSALAATRAAQAQGFDANGCRDKGCEIHCGVEEES
jgi:hypothetical protein